MTFFASPDHPKLGRQVRLKCKLMHAANITVKITFISIVNGTRFKRGEVLQQNSDCSVGMDSTEHYTTFCGMGTKNASSNTKVYLMKIPNTKSEDYTKWVCIIRHGNTTNSDALKLSLLKKTDDPTKSDTST